MAVIALVTADRVRIVESLVQMTLPAAEDLSAGDLVQIDTNGKLALATDSPYGVAAHTVKANFAVTAIHEGVMDGWDLDGLDFNDPVYVSATAGALDDAGTVVVGRVIPGHAAPLADGVDKLVYFDCF